MPEDRGFLLIDKPAGITSFDVIRALRKVGHIRRIGHCGTLDPFATGLLICAVGNYTRLISMLEELPKTYYAVAKLGESTSTGDTEGEVVETAPVPASRLDSEKLVKDALALRELAIPAHSAVKIAGKRAYTLARKGIAPEMPVRPVSIHTFRIESWSAPYLGYTCTVSKGTYIRSLSQWIASRLGTVGHTVELRRLAIGDISVSDAVLPERITEGELPRHFVPPVKLFGQHTLIHADPETLHSLRNGQALQVNAPDCPKAIVLAPDGSVACVTEIRSGGMYPRINIV